MRASIQLLLSAAIWAPLAAHAAPVTELSDVTSQNEALWRRENLCSLKSPPALCQANATVTVNETAVRAYEFYRAFVVDGDPRKMFSLIDSTYKQHHPGYANGPQTIWTLFCGGKQIAPAASSSWCFDASTNMSYANYNGNTDRWLWVDGCVHEHWDQGESIPKDKCVKLDTTGLS